MSDNQSPQDQTSESIVNSTDWEPTDWEPTFDLFKLEYEQSAQRYENIYKAIWQIFQYMALLSGGILTFASKASHFPVDVIVFIALSPLLFWFWATYIPMDTYGQNTRKHLQTIENNINFKINDEIKNKKIKKINWNIKHYSQFTSTHLKWHQWRVRRAVIIFGMIITSAWFLSAYSIFTSVGTTPYQSILWSFVVATTVICIVVSCIDYCSNKN